MPLVQLVERGFPKSDVVGSSPTGHVLRFKLLDYLNSSHYLYNHCFDPCVQLLV